MIPLRLCFAGAAAVLALGGGTALAAPALMGSVAHGNGVSAAVETCSQSTGSARGECTSEAAKTRTTHSSGAHDQNDSASETGSKAGSSPGNEHGEAVSAAAKSCPHGSASDRDVHGDCVSAVAKKTPSSAGGH